MTQFVEIKVRAGSASARKQKEVSTHLGTFVDNKKLQIRGLKVKAIRIEYEEAGK